MTSRFAEIRSAPAAVVAALTQRPVAAVALAVAEPEPAPRVEPLKVVVDEPDPEPELPATGPLKGKTPAEIAATIAAAIESNRIDLYLQPVVTLPQRKVRYYEAMTRLRTEDGTLILPSDFLAHAEKAGLIAKIDNMQMFRCVQVLRRLLLKNREIGLFCNVSIATLNDGDIFRQFFDFLEANRALSSSLTLEFTQSAFRDMGPIEQESLAGLIALGYRFSMDHVTDLRIGPRDLSELGVRFVKVPATLLLNRAGAAADIHAADLSDLLGPSRHQPDCGTDRDRGGGGRPARLRRPLRPGLPVLAAAAGPCRCAAGYRRSVRGRRPPGGRHVPRRSGACRDLAGRYQGPLASIGLDIRFASPRLVGGECQIRSTRG